VLLLAQDDLRDPDAPRLAQRLPEQRVGRTRPLRRQQVVGRLEVPVVDGVRLDELLNLDGLRLLERRRAEVVLRQRDEAPLLVLVALDEVFPGDRLASRWQTRS